MPLTLNLSVQMGSAQIYKNSNNKKKRQLQLSQRSSQKQQKLKNGSQVQSSKRRGDNKQERRWMARKCRRERETKRAGGKVQQQEPRARSHYDSSSSWTSPGVDCKPQSPKPDRETGESVEDRCESGCTRRGGLQHRGPAQKAKNMTSPFFTVDACSTNRCGCIS